MEGLTDILIQAIQHKGMSIVYIFSPCKTFPVLESKSLKSMLQPLPEDHQRDNKMAAMDLAYKTAPMYTGIFYQIQKPTLEDNLQADIQKACAKTNNGKIYTIEQILHSFA